MDPNEQLCKGYLYNAKIAPRIPLERLNEYMKLCREYGYEKELQEIIENRIDLPEKLWNWKVEKMNHLYQ